MVGNIYMVLNYYPKRDPPDLSEFLMWVNVPSNINVFLVVSRESQYNLSLSDKGSKWSITDFTIFIRSIRM